LYGADIANQMLEVIYKNDLLRLSGFISPPSLTRSNRREITFFINGRPVKDSTLNAALTRAYHTLLMVGRFPIAVLFIEMDASYVDVNVHPTKAEVRFQKADVVFSSVQSAIRKALLAHSPVPELENQINWGLDSKTNFPRDLKRDVDWQWSSNQPTSPLSQQQVDTDFNEPKSSHVSATSNQPQLPNNSTTLLRPVGQIATAYLVAEGPDGLYLIDQHAAHERVLFERFMAQRDEKIPSQQLLQPVTVELPPANARLLNQQLHLLNHLGFEVDNFGKNTFIVRAIPQILQNLDPASALRALVEDFEEDETPLQNEIEARIIARVCKRAAVKAGQVLTIEEQRTLIMDLESCSNPRTCPHGRPTMIHLSVDLLERQFGRKGAR
jgi:DNA mismatch repair protein MutL